MIAWLCPLPLPRGTRARASAASLRPPHSLSQMDTAIARTITAVTMTGAYAHAMLASSAAATLWSYHIFCLILRWANCSGSNGGTQAGSRRSSMSDLIKGVSRRECHDMCCCAREAPGALASALAKEEKKPWLFFRVPWHLGHPTACPWHLLLASLSCPHPTPSSAIHPSLSSFQVPATRVFNPRSRLSHDALAWNNWSCAGGQCAHVPRQRIGLRRPGAWMRP